jgi:mono/diheme cytochrome c family protein
MHPRLLATLFLIPSALAGAAEVADYKKTVLPIMKAHCWDCHSNEKEVKGNLALDPETLFDQIGPYNVIRPGNPEESGLVEKLKLEETHADFMPRKGKPLPKREIEAIEAWIRQGAIVDAEKPTEDESKRLATMKPAPLSPSSGESGAAVFHSWKNREGRAIEARMLGLDGESVKLLLRNGKTYVVPLASLDEESAAQAKRLATAP